MNMPKFAKMLKYTLQEQVVITIANWTVKNDRTDLLLVLYTLAEEAGVLSGDRIPRNHKSIILAEYPSAFDSDSLIYFNVTIEKDGE